MAEVLVVGCGFVGSRLARRLADRGHDVTAVTRSGTDLPGVRDLRVDVTRADADLPQADLAFHLVGAPGRTAQAYRRAFVDGLERTVETGAVPVYASSTSVLGDRDGAWVDATTPPRPERPRDEVQLEAEALALEAGGRVVRFAGLYGPGRTPVDRYLDGRPVPAGHVNLLHRDDAASALLHAALEGSRDLYLGVDDEPVHRHDLARWLSDRTGRDHGPLVDEVRRPHKRCRSDALREEGWEPAYPTFRDGLDPLLDG